MPRPVETERQPAPARGERIAKLLARAGIASRREIERMIAEGRVARDGVAISTPATLLPSLAGVTVDGNPVAEAAPARLFLYHKPPGLLVTERDPRGRPTIYDRLPADLPRVVPVGRLDLNTEGLLLLTTDGGLKRQLELPATGVERTYRARAYGPVSQPLLETLIDGIEIDGFRYGPIDANLERRTGANSWIELTLAEGKNREVRRVLEHLGLEVSRLIRTRYGTFVLGDLAAGEVGEVRQGDLSTFRSTLGKQRARGEPQHAIAIRTKASGSPRKPARPAQASEPTTSLRASSSHRPGEGREPVATRQQRSGSARQAPSPPAAAKRQPPQRAASDASRLDPGLRRGRDRGSKAKPTTASEPRKPEASDAPAATRPAKLQRKPGWAKPKPKPGSRPPKKR